MREKIQLILDMEYDSDDLINPVTSARVLSGLIITNTEKINTDYFKNIKVTKSNLSFIMEKPSEC